MLLTEYLGHTYKSTIKCFAFGEHYTIHMENGKGFSFQSLSDILDVMVSEFQAMPSMVPSMSFGVHNQDKMYKVPHAKDRMLIVKPTIQGDIPLPPGYVESVADTVRKAVTMYNLTQTWDSIHAENLK